MPGDYLRLYQRSIADPEGFWREAARAIEWYQAPRQILSTEHDASGAWFPDGICNSSVNCIDRHIRAGRGDQLAIIYDSAMTGTVHRITYHELYDQVARLAGVLDGFGLEKGDRVLIYMPMIPHAVFAMLACARLGLIHSVVFGGFAAAELATRIQHCKPRVIITASCGLEPGKIIAYKPLVDQAITLSEHSVEHVLLLARKQCEAVMQKGRDHDWNEAIEAASPADPVPLQATDPLYILYTSGTTGKPKGVIRDHGGHMVALAWSMRAIYGVEPGDVYWAASDVGWVVGHSYIVYAPLLHGCTTVIYEGKPVGTPDAGAFWRVIADHRVKALFTAPTAIRAIRREDPEGLCFADYDCTSLQHLFLAGERCDPDSLHWAEALLGVPVIDHWWQTETGWSIAANYPGIEMLKVKPGSSGLPAPGYEIAILDPQGKSVPPGQMGAICIRLPMPPSCLGGLWQAEERFKQSYLDDYPGYYSTGDAGYLDEEGYVYVMARTDDVINVAGHRLSTGAIEEVLAQLPDSAECAVVGSVDPVKGQVPLGFLVLKNGVTRPHDVIIAEAKSLVREQIGAIAALKALCIVQRLPKTRSGKILRATMRAIADDKPWKMPATIDDPAILDEISQCLQASQNAKHR